MTDIIQQHNSELDERNIAATDLKSAEDKIQSLCVSHAATFVAVERRGATLTASLNKLLDALDEASPKVEEAKENLEIDGGGGDNACDVSKDGESDDPQWSHIMKKQGISASSSNVNTDGKRKNSLAALAEKHRMRRRTLLQHSSLLELLEMPSLMDACVRGHLYEEGLSIASFANSLERKHLGNETPGMDNPIISNVVKQIRKRETDLRRHLLHRLRSDVTMPQCLEVVTALRRLNGVELERSSRDNTTGINNVDVEKLHEAMEWRLQVNFLEARDVWLEGNAVSNSATLGLASQSSRKIGKRMVAGGNSEQLLDNVDVYRTRCFEIATQFLAIFQSSIQGIRNKSTSSNEDKASQLLAMWTTRRIDTFLNQLLAVKYLPLITETATLRDALESATFFATSMGRIGADFSPLLPSYFVPRLIGIVTSHWIDGIDTLKDTLKVCRDAGIASPLYNSREIISHIGANAIENSDANGVTSQTPSPPRKLLALPPLARLVNSFLIGLNELRRCLLASSFTELRFFFKETFVTQSKAVLIENERAVLKPGFLSKGEEAGKLRSIAAELKEEFDKCVEPYLSNSLEVALGALENVAVEKTPSINPAGTQEDVPDDNGENFDMEGKFEIDENEIESNPPVDHDIINAGPKDES